MTVLMVPVVLVAMMLVVQFGLAYHARQVVAGAAQDGAATAARRDSSIDAGIGLTDALITTSAGQLLRSHSVTGSRSGDVINVTASGEVIRLLPLFPTVQVSATGSATVEQFRPQGLSP